MECFDALEGKPAAHNASYSEAERLSEICVFHSQAGASDAIARSSRGLVVPADLSRSTGLPAYSIPLMKCAFSALLRPSCRVKRYGLSWPRLSRRRELAQLDEHCPHRALVPRPSGFRVMVNLLISTNREY